MILLVILLPFLGFIAASLFGKWLGHKGSSLLTVVLMFCNVLIAFILFYFVCFLEKTYFINLGTWINSGLFQINWVFYFDNLTVIMLLVVNIISFLVHLYSTDYMAHDPHVSRFMSYLSLFTFFMILLVTGDNFIILFLGWEGVGLCSYLLISFWYTRIQANKSAMKALIVNRISDFGLTIGLVIIFFIFKSLDFGLVFGLIPFFIDKTFILFGFEFNIINTIAALLFFGACGKSAQIGLHTWLPDAMEGPTPVSALIHAATMVTAGVFLIIKCSPIFEFAPTILTVITFIGALTAFFSATVGLVQNDIKKIIAYSTCSQLGYMIFACGLSNYHVGFFHLVNHAFFKALLFLSAGAIIHSLSNEQDLRKYGGLSNLLPFTSVMLMIGSLALIGFPFLTGFYSKDLILELAFSKYTIAGTFAYWIGVLTAFFTSFYSYRIFYLTFISKPNMFKKTAENVHELPYRMAFSLIILSFGSIFLGYMSKDLFVGLGTGFWNQSIFILPQNNNQLEAEFIPHMIKLLPFFGSMIAVSLVNFIFDYNLQVTNFLNFNLKNIYTFLSFKWYFDVLYNKFINNPTFYFIHSNIFTLLDKGIIESLGPTGISYTLYKIGYGIKAYQTGQIFHYGYFIIFNLLVIFIALEFLFI